MGIWCPISLFYAIGLTPNHPLAPPPLLNYGQKEVVDWSHLYDSVVQLSRLQGAILIEPTLESKHFQYS